MTSDSGKTFSKIILEPQELDSTALDAVSSGQSSSADNKLKWSDVYKEALVPVFGSDGTITVYLRRVPAAFIITEKRQPCISQQIRVQHSNILDSMKSTRIISNNHYRKKFIKIPEIA